MKPFDLQKALAGHPLVTRDGSRVEGFAKAINEIPGYPYTAYVDAEKKWYTANGTYYFNGGEYELDLFLSDSEDIKEKPSETKETCDTEPKRKRVYISGAITGRPIEDVRREFDMYEQILTNMGADVANPLKNGLSDKQSWAEHMIADLRILRRCDAVIMIGNWMFSRGAIIEYVFSKGAGIRVIDTKKCTLDELIRTLRDEY